MANFFFFIRYMHDHTKTDDSSGVDSLDMPIPSSSGGRTRRTGLLTVTERPPGKSNTSMSIHIN